MNYRLNRANSVEWVSIQTKTFMNWANEQLRSRNLKLDDLRTDLYDGVKLAVLVEVLQRRKIGTVVHRPINQYERLQNVTLTLDAISRDIRLVNIDSTDIVAGNTKLILALVWQLITRYQIELLHYHHKDFILKWLQVVIPDCEITNLTSDWNSGIALHALIEFCKPGSCPDWRNLNPDDRVWNCRQAMALANKFFHIPLVLLPEDLASRNLDESSSLTYLSYFTKLSSPGYFATLRHIRRLLFTSKVSNFTTDWNDGRLLCELVTNVGGDIPGWPDLDGTNADILNSAIGSARYLGVKPVVSGEEISAEKSAHIGLMAYLAQFVNMKVDHSSEELRHSQSKVIPYSDIDYSSYRTTSVQMGSDIYSMNPSSGRLPSDQYSIASSKTTVLSYNGQDNSFDSPHAKMVDTYSVGVIFDTKIQELITDKDDIVVEAHSPTGRIITMTGESVYKALFSTSEIGIWKVKLFYRSQYIDSCHVAVCDPSRIRIDGLDDSTTGIPIHFTVDSTDSGAGDVELEVFQGGRRLPLHVNRTQEGYVLAEFTPWQPGTYRVKVIFNGIEVKDTSHISTDPEVLQRRAMFHTSLLDMGSHVKVNLKCDWQIDYLTGGPFLIKVIREPDVKVHAVQNGPLLNKPELIVDCTNAGDGDLEVDVTRKGRSFPTEIREEKPRVYRAKFQPEEPGSYKVRVHYDGREVKGSPFVQEVDTLEKPKLYGDGLYQAEENKPAAFHVNPHGQNGKLETQINGPTSSPSSIITREPSGHFAVQYTPVETGIHTLYATWNDDDLEGSPFHPRVVNPNKVKLAPEGIPIMDEKDQIPLTVNQPKEIHYDTSGAGPGELTASIQGPSRKLPVVIDSPQRAKKILSFTPEEEGPHQIGVAWSGHPLPGTPYQGYAVPDTQEKLYARRPRPVSVSEPLHRKKPPPSSRPASATPKVILKGHGLKEANVDKVAEFTIDGRDTGNGEPMVQLTGVGKRVDVEIEKKSPNFYKCSYVPKLPGAYLLNICWNRCQLKGAPYKVHVKGPEYADKVKINENLPEKLKNNVVGKDIDIRLDPRQAGPGLLTADCRGPTRPVEYSFNKNPDGTQTLKLTPREQGNHILEIKFNNLHVYGSPYQMYIGANPNKGIITVTGPGIEHGVLAKYQSHFYVNAEKAGAGELKISLMGPKGGFKTEMHRTSQKDKIFYCRYNPLEPGTYTINVKWSGVDVDNSPFQVHIAANEWELQRVLNAH